MMRCFLLGLVFAFGCAAGAMASEPLLKPDQIATTGLSKPQAKAVLILVLQHLKFKLNAPGMFLDGDLGKNGVPIRPGYYDFSLSYDTPDAAAMAYLGYYSVNIMTGDVWESEQCEHYTFPALRKLQKQIMRRTGATMLSVAKARASVGC